MEIVLTGSTYLDVLNDDVARLADLLQNASVDPAQPLDALVAAALSLEGVAPDTIPPVATALAATDRPPAQFETDPRAGSWQDTLQLDDPDPHVLALLRAREVRGIVAADVLDMNTDDLVACTRELHVALTTDLVAPSRQGMTRQFDVAVHDSGSGRILYQPVTPDNVADSMHALAGFLTDARANGMPDVTLAAVALYALHVIQPFDAANGRVAVLYARRLLSPDKRCGVETVLAADRGGFHAEIAQTLRRGDSTFFAERYAEALAMALRKTAQAAGLVNTTPTLDAHTLSLLRENETLTITALADQDVSGLQDAGLLSPMPGMHGLKFVSHLAR